MSLVLDDVTRLVGGEAFIHPTSFEMAAGGVNVLLGPTQAGKTSLMRLIAGLDRPTSGRIMFKGRDVTGVSVRARNVAMVYQQFINYPALSVYENIASPLRIQRRSAAEIDSAVRRAAALLKLDGQLSKTPLQLSGGQQQRTAIARALVKKADIVLLDEPLANLDYKLREELRIELPRIFESTGSIFIYATTEPAEALLLGGKTATMHEGCVTQFGQAAEVFRRPRDRVTAETYSDPPMNFIDAQLQGGQIVIEGLAPLDAAGGMRGLADGRYALGFRPHHLTLAPATPRCYRFKSNVVVSELSGSESFLHVEMAGARWIALVHGVHDVPAASRLDLYLAPERLFAFSPDGALARAPDDAAAA